MVCKTLTKINYFSSKVKAGADGRGGLTFGRFFFAYHETVKKIAYFCAPLGAQQTTDTYLLYLTTLNYFMFEKVTMQRSSAK